MKVQSVAVNRTEQNPEGVLINVIHPESPMEQNLLIFLLEGYLRRQVETGKIKLDLPAKVLIDYRGQGAFAISTPSQAGTTYPYYQAPQLLTVVLIREVGNRFDVVYSRRDQAEAMAGKGAGGSKGDAGDTAPVQADESTDHSLDMPAPPPEPVDDIDQASLISGDDAEPDPTDTKPD